MAPPRPPRSLHRILPPNPPGVGTPPSSLDIVIVPAPGIVTKEWAHGSADISSTWLQSLVNDFAQDFTPGATIFEHHYDDGTESSLAEHLTREGTEFLRSLRIHCVETEMGLNKRPLVLICHGTGGLVVKRALNICCSEQPHEYRPVIDVLSGAVFLGVPHIIKDREAAKKTIDLLLKCKEMGSTRQHADDAGAKYLTQICEGFERIGLKIPVISAYETKSTAPPRSFFRRIFSKVSNQVIVPRTWGTLRLRSAKEVEIDSRSNHTDVCKVRAGSDLYKECLTLLREIMREAPERIAKETKPTDAPALRAETLRSGGVQDESLQEFPTGMATNGSTVGSIDLVAFPKALDYEAVPCRDPKLPCFWLGNHQRNDQFFGRQDIFTMIDDVLLFGYQEDQAADPVQPRSFAICGMGGMGKTELAVEYAYSRKDKFQAIFWLSADEASILASNFAQIAKKLGLEDENDESDLAASREVVMDWLARPLKKMPGPETPANLATWLIIFDNVDDIHVISEFWPKFGRGSVLVTSRDPLAKHSWYVESPAGIDLAPFSKNETEALLQRLTNVKANTASPRESEALSTMAQKLDGFPMAISQMSGVFRRLRLVSYSGFLDLFNEEGIHALFQWQAESSKDQQKGQSLATYWALDTLPKESMALLRVISLLDPDDIPEDLLIDRKKVVKLEGYPTSRGEYHNAKAELLASSLMNQHTETYKLRLHRLVQDATRRTMKPDELISAFEAASNLVLEAWPFQSMINHHSVERFGKCEALFPSVLRLKNRIELQVKEYPGFPLDIRLAQLFNDTGWYRFERGMMEETEPFCQFALEIAARLEAKLGAAAVAESIRESHMCLGIVLTELNEHDRSLFHKKKWLNMLEERKTEAGQDIANYELGYAYNEIGVAYGNANQLEEAVKAFQRSTEIFKGLADYKNTMLGWPQPNLGFIYWMQGKLQEAESTLVEIQGIHTAAWGVDDTVSFKTGKILYAIGNVLWAQGRFDESFSYHLRCLKQYKTPSAPTINRVGDTYHRLAFYYIHKGIYTEAETSLNLALIIFNSRTYLKNERARTTYKKGELLKLMKKEEEANALLEEAYQLRRHLVPGDQRPREDVREADFDLLVPYWSR
ncbi:unnamed protein product [Sordaria macrospora k-hell]|uniref:WGS project CABT00000000 data, contig 2.67 n=1 Tax=Sordaria macrospora (strain ATCC MYA-333 / DSM 997 / K(L3346) / K-hell) TaxID=771870 RepID=F7WAX7_SORMK|nr:uncharacterized protein SMAC_12808 [Sordaria macrospora k-hell]CCC14292.1 unnamed protein product [Sordaria macrospora k-hell]